MAGIFSISKMLAGVSSLFRGFIASVDLVNQVVIPFPFAPTKYSDRFNSEFDYASSPGGRYQYPIFKNTSPRTIEFIARYDQSYPASNAGFNNKYLRGKLDGVGNGTLADIVLATEIANVIAAYEKLKLPKRGSTKVFRTSTGKFLRVSPGVNDPSPPLCLLVRNPQKMYLGYLGNATIDELRYNKYMMPTRIAVGVQFLVTPDLIFTSMEDALREVQAVLSWFSA
jgi:hypothetical protein